MTAMPAPSHFFHVCVVEVGLISNGGLRYGRFTFQRVNRRRHERCGLHRGGERRNTSGNTERGLQKCTAFKKLFHEFSSRCFDLRTIEALSSFPEPEVNFVFT